MPRMISGATIGSSSSVSAVPAAALERMRARPRPRRVPSTVETMTRHLERHDQRLQEVVVVEQRGIPIERKAAPGEVALRDVEAEQDEDRDGDEQEDVDEQGIRGQQPVALAMHD